MPEIDRHGIFKALGFRWDQMVLADSVPTWSVERVCFRFRKMLPQFVWETAVLEGNPFTFPEVKTLLDGITVGGRKVSDHEQILNLADAGKYVLESVLARNFTLSKKTFTTLNGLIARNESLEWGVFRGEGHETNYSPDVMLGERGRYVPTATRAGAPELNHMFESAVMHMSHLPPFERALSFFLFGSLHQFFFDGNKRTSRFMMNGILMSNGIDAIGIPADRAQEFNMKMVDFYISKDATDMMDFLMSCHPDAERIVVSRPESSSATTSFRL